jgi:hypothetical protein
VWKTLVYNEGWKQEETDYIYDLYLRLEIIYLEQTKGKNN